MSRDDLDFEIVEGTRPYYDRVTLDAALADAITTIDEWSYEDDPHGYCHQRPILVRLVEAVHDLRAVQSDLRHERWNRS